MPKIYMLSRYAWSTDYESGERVFGTSCESAVLGLLAKGYKRTDFQIDFLTSVRNTNTRKISARFVEAYGVTGSRFMPEGVLVGAECPPSTSERVPARLRKTVLVCPHCQRTVRRGHWKHTSQSELDRAELAKHECPKSRR